MKKKNNKTGQVVYETHGRELHLATNNKPIRVPYLSDSEKTVEPYDSFDQGTETEYFESGELTYFKRIGMLRNLLHKMNIEFEYIMDDEVFEFSVISEKHVEPLLYYVFVEDGKYHYAFYDMDYEVKFSGNLEKMKAYLKGIAIVKRKEIIK